MLKDTAKTGGDLRVVGNGASPEPELTGRDPERLLELVRTLLERNHQLERALESRILIEQAKGILAERLALGPDQAFEVLRRGARNNRIRIHALARAVVESPVTPKEIRGTRAP